jgi:hypothetical protein
MGDVLFNSVVSNQGDKPWGRFLDAGTGLHSLKWIQTLDTTSWTAITADTMMKSSIEHSVTNIRPDDHLLVGNWMDESFCSRLGTFDTVLADYLIGAVDGFSPYEQDTILKKLRNHINPGGRLYLIGMNPIPDHVSGPADIVTEVRRARDASIQLAGHRPYREFPVEWILRHLETSGFKIVTTKQFTILHSEDSIKRQIRVGQSKLPLIEHAGLRAGMESYLQDLANRVSDAVKSTPSGRLPVSFDYIVVAEPI